MITPEADSYDYDLLVVGGGIAGLTTAAQYLDKARADGKDTPRIAILEASSRLGGRIRTVHSGGRTFDVGGQWLHGGLNNQFYQWAAPRYAFDHTNEPIGDMDIILRDRAFDGGYRTEALGLLEDAWNDFEAKNPGEDMSLYQLLARVRFQGKGSFGAMMASLWMAVDKPTDVSCRDFFGDPHSSGGIVVKEGMQSLVGLIEDELIERSVTIIRNAPVASLSQSEKGVVALDKNGIAYTAPQATVTVPMPVLQREQIHFNAAFSKPLKEALDGIGSAKLAKVIVPVRDQFFAANKLTVGNRIYNLRSTPIVALVRSGGVERSYIGLMLGGNFAARTEALFANGPMAQAGRIEFVERAFHGVRQMDGIRDHVDGDILVTDWSHNALSQGSYTAAKPGYDRPGVLQEGRIVFAGEGFSRSQDGGGAISGAFMSAKFAADKLYAGLKP